MFSFMSYELPTGWRSLVLVEVRDAERPFSVLDIPLDSDPLREDADWRVVGHEIEDYATAREVGREHYLRSMSLGRPAAAA